MFKITKFKLAEFISTFIYVGKRANVCPGTVGSIATMPLWLIVMFIILKLRLNFILASFFTVIILFFVGLWTTKIYINETKKDDPKEVVIDEVVGQLLSFIFSFSVVIFAFVTGNINNLINFSVNHHYLLQLFLFVTPVAFFRLFDIKKPLFIGWIDKNIKSPLGVMLDDVVAGICAGIVNSAVLCLLMFMF